jgi:hypothetical protein
MSPEAWVAVMCMTCYAIGHFVGKWTERGQQERAQQMRRTLVGRQP